MKHTVGLSIHTYSIVFFLAEIITESETRLNIQPFMLASPLWTVRKVTCIKYCWNNREIKKKKKAVCMRVQFRLYARPHLFGGDLTWIEHLCVCRRHWQKQSRLKPRYRVFVARYAWITFQRSGLGKTCTEMLRVLGRVELEVSFNPPLLPSLIWSVLTDSCNF